MATLFELYELSSDTNLIAKVSAAIAILAEDFRVEAISGSPPVNVDVKVSWASRALLNPDGEARKFIWLLLAQNKTFTKAQIQAASDASIQTAVADAVELFLR